MAIRINFDSTHNVIQPTIVLGTRSGKKIGQIPHYDLVVKDGMNSPAELSFSVNKCDFVNTRNDFWDKIADFKLIWVKEWNKWFEISVTLDESTDTIKNVTAKALGESELSQVNLYDIEINTELDIEREDYKPTVLYNDQNKKASLLHRITEKVPHYKFGYISPSVANIQRTFQFNDRTIYDAFQEIAEEMKCLFVINCYSDSDNSIIREINVYDLESYCFECGERGDFNGKCPECNSENIIEGYGNDTTIFISTENLAENITYQTDNGSVKNCFKLEAGDDLMTATIINCNPNGSNYIWHISEDVKEDMSDNLVQKLKSYDELYNYYQKEYNVEIDPVVLSNYNSLISKYKVYTEDYPSIVSPVVGYPELMQTYYNVIDFYYYLKNSLMPSVDISQTTAVLEAAKISYANIPKVAVQNLASCSSSTATSAVLSMAKAIVNERYQVKVSDDNVTFENHIWSGSFVITNYSDENDEATTYRVSVPITDDYETFVKQRIKKLLSNQTEEITDISQLFAQEDERFVSELKKYSLSRLEAFREACQSCLDILIQQGIADSTSWLNEEPNLYTDLYLPYYYKLKYIEDEIIIREYEISLIVGVRDSKNGIVKYGISNILESEKNKIQNYLNFEKYLGENLWNEFSSYRREDTYSNSNFISTGLDNLQLFKNALDFIEIANKDIFKSANLQHSISASLKNLLVMKEFSPLVDYFEVGNWLRVKVDGKIYKLRLLEYEIRFSDLDNISIVFSDVIVASTGMSDVESILNEASSMASSYGAIAYQANQGKRGKDQLNDWVEKGLSLTKLKIIDNADNQNISWDNHGLLCREYLPITDDYDKKQTKIISKGLYLTDDNWLTSRAGIGDFVYFDPIDQVLKEGYGVIADTLVGNLILSEKVGIFNSSNSIVMDENGFVLTTENETDNNRTPTFTIQKKETDELGDEVLNPIMYVNSNGDLVLNGSIHINTTDESVSTLNDMCDFSRFSSYVESTVDSRVNGIYETINDKFRSVMEETSMQLENYKAEVGQYMDYGSNGLTLGAKGSSFKTVIDNRSLRFTENNTTVAYINNNQLNILNAIIRNSLLLGNFFFSPRNDGGFSITWQE